MQNITFDILEKTRLKYIEIVDQFNIEQLNTIPSGFNNNVTWNFGHAIITHQLLCYGLSNQPLTIPKDLVKKYRKGSRPDSFIEQDEIDLLKNLALDTVSLFREDFSNGIFEQYNPYKTSFGIHLTSIQQAVIFNNVHEGMHLGTCIAIKQNL